MVLDSSGRALLQGIPEEYSDSGTEMSSTTVSGSTPSTVASAVSGLTLREKEQALKLCMQLNGHSVQQMHDLQSQLNLAIEEEAETTLKLRQMEKMILEQRESTPSIQERDGRFASWLGWLLCALNCPRRFYPKMCHTRTLANHDAVAWEVLSAVPGAAALLCRARDLQVLQATATACKIWKASTLEGVLLESLIASQRRAGSLKMAVQKPCYAEVRSGLKVRKFGCVEMLTDSGACFDAFLQIVHLPESRVDVDNCVVISIAPVS